MRRRLTTAAILLALIPAGANASPWADQFFETQEHDFGKVQRGEKLNHQFLLRNTSNKEVRIKRIKVSCGCTTATASVENIEPGGAATIDAIMDTSGFQGSKSVTIFVQFDRPWRVEIPLRVSCTSVGNISAIGGSEVDFGVVPSGASVVKRLNLDYTGNPKWEVTGLDFGNPSIRAEVAEISRDAKLVRYELTITLSDSAPAGVIEDKIRIQTNDAQASQILVTAKAKVEPKLSASPDNLRLTGLAAGQKITKNVIVKAGSPFKIIRVDNTNGLFEVRSSPEPKKTQLLVVTLTVPDDVSKVPNHLSVVTDLPEEQSLSIGIQE